MNKSTSRTVVGERSERTPSFVPTCMRPPV